MLPSASISSSENPILVPWPSGKDGPNMHCHVSIIVSFFWQVATGNLPSFGWTKTPGSNALVTARFRAHSCKRLKSIHSCGLEKSPRGTLVCFPHTIGIIEMSPWHMIPWRRVPRQCSAGHSVCAENASESLVGLTRMSSIHLGFSIREIGEVIFSINILVQSFLRLSEPKSYRMGCRKVATHKAVQFVLNLILVGACGAQRVETHLHIPSIGQNMYRPGIGQWESSDHSVAVRSQSNELTMLCAVLRIII